MTILRFVNIQKRPFYDTDLETLVSFSKKGDKIDIKYVIQIFINSHHLDLEKGHGLDGSEYL